MSDGLPALLDTERLKKFCLRIGLTHAPIFSEPKPGQDPTDLIAATWVLIGFWLASPPRRSRRGRPKKLVTRGLLYSNDVHEQRAYYVDLIRLRLRRNAGDEPVTDAEIIADIQEYGPLLRLLREPFDEGAAALFKTGARESLAKSVSRGRAMRGAPAKRGRPRKKVE